MTELSPEQIAEIRGSLDRDSDEFVQDRVVRDLCDTADALRADRDAAMAELSVMRRLAEQDDELSVALFDANRDLGAELKTMRGIAKRLADGWAPCVDTLANPTRYGWEDTTGTRPSGLDDFDLRVEPMTPAEVQAIYGQKEKSDES